MFPHMIAHSVYASGPNRCVKIFEIAMEAPGESVGYVFISMVTEIKPVKLVGV